MRSAGRGTNPSAARFRGARSEDYLPDAAWAGMRAGRRRKRCGAPARRAGQGDCRQALPELPRFRQLPQGALQQRRVVGCGGGHGGAGRQRTPAEIEAVVAYLAKNFGEGVGVRINTAPFAEIKVVLGFTVAEVRALLEYREKNGDLKSFEELLKVPGIDAAKAGAQRARITF